MTSGPSDQYRQAIEEGMRHHAATKTYSGSLLRPHKPFIIDLSRRLGCKSGLDVGTGKGVQYRWVDPSDGLTIEQALGFAIIKYDPCWPPYAAEPAGRYDLVICTHTVSLIPTQDLVWFVERLCDFSCKAVFIAEKIGERKKAEVADPQNRAIKWPAKKWVDFIAERAKHHPNLVIVLSLRERLERGTITTRHIWEDGRYRAVEAVPRGIS